MGVAPPPEAQWDEELHRGSRAALDYCALRDGLLSAIATHCGSCDWTVDHAGSVVMLDHPEEQTFDGQTLEEGLA